MHCLTARLPLQTGKAWRSLACHSLEQQLWVSPESGISVISLLQAVRRWLIHIYRLAMGMLLRAWEFLLRVCSSADRPLHFIKLQLRVPEGVPRTGSLFWNPACLWHPRIALLLKLLKASRKVWT